MAVDLVNVNTLLYVGTSILLGAPRTPVMYLGLVSRFLDTLSPFYDYSRIQALDAPGYAPQLLTPAYWTVSTGLGTDVAYEYPSVIFNLTGSDTQTGQIEGYYYFDPNVPDWWWMNSISPYVVTPSTGLIVRLTPRIDLISF